MGRSSDRSRQCRMRSVDCCPMASSWWTRTAAPPAAPDPSIYRDREHFYGSRRTRPDGAIGDSRREQALFGCGCQ